MKIIDAIVTARDGSDKELPAKVIICPECDGDTFSLYYFREDQRYLHLQCARCTRTYCAHAGECNAGDMN